MHHLNDFFVLQEIANETDVPITDLHRALQSLACGKANQRVLLKEPRSKDIGEGFVLQ